MLHQVPSGSKSGGFGFFTGLFMMNSLRLAIIFQDRSALTLTTPLGISGTPCEQPAPARIAYRSFPINATSATPWIPLPPPGAVVLEGRCVTKVVRTPSQPTREIRAPVSLPV